MVHSPLEVMFLVTRFTCCKAFRLLYWKLHFGLWVVAGDPSDFSQHKFWVHFIWNTCEITDALASGQNRTSGKWFKLRRTESISQKWHWRSSNHGQVQRFDSFMLKGGQPNSKWKSEESVSELKALRKKIHQHQPRKNNTVSHPLALAFHPDVCQCLYPTLDSNSGKSVGS